MTRVALVLLPLLVTLGLAGCTNPSPVESTRILLDVTATAPAEPREEEVPLRSTVTLVVASEVDGLLHVHGFDEEVDLVAGQTSDVTFRASMAGAFEVETHDPDAVWMKLVVS